MREEGKGRGGEGRGGEGGVIRTIAQHMGPSRVCLHYRVSTTPHKQGTAAQQGQRAAVC